MLVPVSEAPSLPCLSQLFSFKVQIKVISSKKSHLHASVIPESLAQASIKAHTEYCDLFPCLMLDSEVFQGRDWVFTWESLPITCSDT